jgi:hypothetical protein
MNALSRSRVVHELALRPGFSAQAQMPPTARSASRGERRGLLVLTAGSVSCFYRRYPTGPVASSLPDERSGVLALFLPRGPNRGTGRVEDHDADGTERGSAQARRVQSRSRVAAGLVDDRCPTMPELPARRHANQSPPGSSERPPLRVPDAIVRPLRTTAVGGKNESADPGGADRPTTGPRAPGR